MRELWKKVCSTLKLTMHTINDERFTGMQWSDQELRNFELLQGIHTVNICTVCNVANRLSTVSHQHVCFCEVVWLVGLVAFQADSDFFVVAELLKDYIGLIQAVKVRNDVLTLQYFNISCYFVMTFSLIYTHWMLGTCTRRIIWSITRNVSLETFRAKHRQFVYRVLCCCSR